MKENAIIKKLISSAPDSETLAAIEIDPDLQKDDFYDYSKTVVRKPWGYEYLIFQNEHVAVWVLFIKQGFETSLHCHPGKKTSLIVLSGEVACFTLGERISRSAGEGILIGKGVFHRTRAVSRDGVFVMEIETPPNKKELVRFKDKYGRESMGYEGPEHFSLNTHNYNYMSFIDVQAYYNAKKRFGRCSIEVSKFKSRADFIRRIDSEPWDLVNILRGKISSAKEKAAFGVGDVFSRQDIGSCRNLRFDGELEVMIIRQVDTMVRVSDFIISYLKKKGIRDFFFVPDPSNAHLIDAVGRDTDIRFISFQTEHAATLAAEAHSKITGRPCVAIVSSGSSAAYALTGLADSWVDSAPVFILSSQSRKSEFGAPGETTIRQLANKELDIISMVKPITKYSALIRNPSRIKCELEKAYFLSTHGRKGPVWLDVPIDILGTNIDESEFLPVENEKMPRKEKRSLGSQIDKLIRLLKASSRPVILAGHGVRAAGAEREFIKLARLLAIPVLTSRRGADIVPSDFPLYFGRPGTYGQRMANFVIQNADLLLTVGTRLSFPLIGRNYASFARAAKKIIVDIDAEETRKITVRPDMVINADAGNFIKALSAKVSPKRFSRPRWLRRCRQWRERFTPQRDYLRSASGRGINPYCFIESLSECLKGKDIIVADGGCILDYIMQAFKVKSGQRIIASPGLEYQGFALAGSIGACIGSSGQKIICLSEKKGFERNLSELSTIVHNGLPIKIFIFDSKVDTHVKRVQSSYFGSRYVGSENGSSNIIRKQGEAYNMRTCLITSNNGLRRKIAEVISEEGAALCEVDVSEQQEILPRMVFSVKPDGKWISKPLEDMYPFLDRKEFKENMIVDILEED